MDETAVYILTQQQKERTTGRNENTGELKSIILTDGSLDSKSYTFYDSKGMTSWKSPNYRDRQLICWQELGMGTRD